ncbi:3-dehydroquinate synthase [Aquibacillus koreensis]|uniref:3-dehydroquinate synthase n=1 Tax=Aquibacillus koreensis TaxID=279446 RepID=A0A9X3WK19_9BACI|nr:3-dehydroquinate synthase [Aquibacillus koreensis]MCT2537383.1 3-dehydroquinate synthase [Aquibacillus koreensis]MDC3418829.1 3-dehydroquinate synthase [Aquibacillus koreensis]
MEQLTIKSSTNKYPIFVGTKLRFKTQALIGKEYNNIMIITDSSVESLYLQDVVNSFSEDIKISYAVVAAGESSKDISNYYDLMTAAIKNGLDRHSLIIALGGGMVGDLAGFVAATYMRGIDFIQMPTTILAHDSSVGGKVAINHPEGKNLIGNFYPPQAVIYDVETLHSLSDKEIRSGYAEVIKHGLISDQLFFDQVRSFDITTKIKDEDLTEHILKGIAVKAKIVELDEKESNQRKYLNLGHTLGHALESELGYGQITHGEAVAIGMLFALQVSENIYNSPLPYKELYEWLDRNKYPFQLPSLSVETLLGRMKKDKKSRDLTVQMVLLKGVGQPTIETLDDELLSKYLDDFLRELGKS